jgi:alpha-L-fucosidase
VAIAAHRAFISGVARLVGLGALLGLLCASSTAAPAQPTTSPTAVPPTDANSLAWFRDAKLGLFIHWGPVSLKGTEIGWSRGAQVPTEEYDQLYRHFNPTNFNADAWASLAKELGARYLVLTSKHHDGFCLWDSKFTDYDIMNTPFARDVVKELADACRRQSVVFCTYHSICDWHHPDYPLGSPGGKAQKPSPNMDRYNTYLKNQVAELIQNYGGLGIMWFDGEWEAPWTHERGVDLYRHCRQLQPSILVNNRVGKGRSGMEGTTAAGAFAGDYDTPEQQVGAFQTARAWESCITICEQWAWKPNDKLKSLKQCIDILVRTVGGDGNLLLNVGPMPGGEIEPRQMERLRELGAWLRANGQSIFGTRGGPFKPAAWGASTHQGDTIYVHVLDWKGSETLPLPKIERKVTRASLLAGGKVEFEQSGDGLALRVPLAAQPPLATVIALRLDGPAADLAPR